MARFSLDWSSADLSGHMPGGVYNTRAEAEAAQVEWLAELLDICGSEEERAGILAGRMDISEIEG